MKKAFLLIALTTCTVLRINGETSLTIYNKDFAIIRDSLKLDLKAGVNDIRYSDVALFAEPSSVILRDPSGKTELQIQEQAFRGSAVTQETMLAWFEGQTIDFLRYDEGKSHVIPGKIIRSGRIKIRDDSNNQKEPPLMPIIEVEGKTQFELPGTPRFPPLSADRTIKPEFLWKIATPAPVQLNAEIAYTAYGIHWFADYNVITAEDSDAVQLLGWMTINNETGKSFENTRVKFVAGMISKMEPRAKPSVPEEAATERTIVTGSYINNQAKELDEYYVYTHPAPISLKDREQKQVQFLHAEGVQSKKIFAYYGAANDIRASGNGANLNPDDGVESTTRVHVMREFKNTAANDLGVPLPLGRMRYFRRSADQELEFIGESDVPATSANEMVQADTGFAFDLVGERTRTNFEVDPAKHTAAESFEIKLRNHKKVPVEIRVIENLGRWHTWEINAKSDPFTKKDAHMIEFNVPVKPGEERKLSFTVLYTKLPTLKDAQ
ncbi:MAG: hypothetical protein DLM73_04280 [Chthoniobacterales bacterium]|nr:MAG: hypothetical protein DLM73_04280 [Chthoniobacterales bacterium]